MNTAPERKPRRSMLLRLAVVLVVTGFVVLLAYGLATKAPNDTIDSRLAEAQAAPAPGFELPVLQRGELGRQLQARLAPALADGRIRLAELRGAPVVLNFWASWCVPCRVEAPRLEAGWRRAQGRGVIFVGLNMQDVTEDARNFLRGFKVSYLNVRDKSNDVALRWGVTGIPETFFISAQGKVVAHVSGALSSQQLREGERAAERGRPLGALEGGGRRSTR